jgi:hypothetical protein
MKTRRILRKKTNKTISKRNTKQSAKKRVRRRKTMKGGYSNQFNDTGTPTLLDRSKAKLRYMFNVGNIKNTKTDRINFSDDKADMQDVYSYQLLTDDIQNIPIIEVLKIVFKKEPIGRFSSTFHNVQPRQIKKIEELGDALSKFNNDEFDKEFTANQIEESNYCIKKKESRGDAYKLCEYIPYAMKYLQGEMNTRDSNYVLMFGKNNEGLFRFYWRNPSPNEQEEADLALYNNAARAAKLNNVKNLFDARLATNNNA